MENGKKSAVWINVPDFPNKIENKKKLTKKPESKTKELIKIIQPNLMLSVGHWDLDLIWTLEIGHSDILFGYYPDIFSQPNNLII